MRCYKLRKYLFNRNKCGDFKTFYSTDLYFLKCFLGQQKIEMRANQKMCTSMIGSSSCYKSLNKFYKDQLNDSSLNTGSGFNITSVRSGLVSRTCIIDHFQYFFFEGLCPTWYEDD